MNATKAGLFTVLALANIALVIGWIRAARRLRLRERPTLGDSVIGFVTTYLDALGIGSFAPTTALFKFRGRPADELIPGTLNGQVVGVDELLKALDRGQPVSGQR